jgi:hypothetical protein
MAAAVPSTVTPGKAPTGANRAPGKAPSSVRRPARPPGAIPEATLLAPPKGEKRGGRSWGMILGCAVCALLLVAVAGGGGVVALVFVLNEKKAEPSPPVTIVTPAEKAPPETKVVEPRPPEKVAPPESKPAPESKPGEPKAPGEVKPPPPEARPVEQPKTVAPKADDSGGTALLQEDFKDVDVGARPKGWEGDAFGVQREDDRPCLEVTNPSGLHYVTLPRLALKGDFILEAELRLGGSSNVRNPFFGDAVGHELHLEMGSLTSTPLTVLVTYLGDVRLGDGQVREAQGFKPFENIHFRLTRKADVYSVSINDRVTVGATIPGKGKFEEVRIGLPGGKVPSVGKFGGDFVARLYSLKIVSLSKDVEKSGGAGPVPGFREDFSKVAAGTLPDGWGKPPQGNLAVEITGGEPGLELLNPEKGADSVELPHVELKGDFFADFAVVFPPDSDGLLTVQFKSPKDRVEVQMSARRQVGSTGLRPVDAARFWNAGKANVLRVERSAREKACVVRVNDAEVMRLPLTPAAEPVASIELALAPESGPRDNGFGNFGGFAKKKSPQVTYVRVMPLEQPAPNP